MCNEKFYLPSDESPYPQCNNSEVWKYFNQERGERHALIVASQTGNNLDFTGKEIKH